MEGVVYTREKVDEVGTKGYRIVEGRGEKCVGCEWGGRLCMLCFAVVGVGKGR